MHNEKKKMVFTALVGLESWLLDIVIDWLIGEWSP